MNDDATGTSILVVEDNPIDVRMLRFAFAQVSTWAVELVVAEDGEKAIQMLEDGGRKNLIPDLVTLDLNLPKISGKEVLRFIRTTEGLRELPVAVVSSSPMDIIRDQVAEDVSAATCCFTKPLDAKGFRTLGGDLRSFYLERRPSSLR